MNNKEIRRTQNENDQELLIFEEPMPMIPNDSILMELFLDVCEYGAEAMVKMGKMLLGVVVILKVHEVYGKRKVRPALLVNAEVKIRT